MSGDKQQYDLVCSLGGNCAVAHNLRWRNMRAFSLPFDWVFITDVKPIEYLATAFANRFSDFFLRENLIQVAGTASHGVVYMDKVSGYYFPNHFLKPISTLEDYERVAQRMRRRVQRLYEKIENAQKILFVLATDFAFDVSCVRGLQTALRELYPDKQLTFKVLQFGAAKDMETSGRDLTVTTYRRRMNDYDLYKTNWEWSFLDSIALPYKSEERNRKRICSFKLNKRKFTLYVFWDRMNEVYYE